MLDIRLLREAPEEVRNNLLLRRVTVFEDLTPAESDWADRTVGRLVELDERYRMRLQEEEALRQQQNANAEAMKAVGRLPKDEQATARAPLVEEGRALRERERTLTQETEQARQARDEAWAGVPNMTHPEVPQGHTDEDHAVLHTWGTPRDFGAEGLRVKDHLELGETLGIIDFESGAKVAGQKFYYLRGDAVMLELALQHYALQVAKAHGFEIHVTPDLARAEVARGLGFNPRGESTQIYSIADSDLCLVGTAEITLGGMLADRILEQDELPLLLAGVSHCFRTEAGAAGQESRGLYRVHQFTKVELFAFTEGELAASEAMHAKMLAIEEEIFQGLGIPYRVLDMAAGDLGGPAYRKYDLEAWMPGRGAWGEITSTSNCTDYQARRLRIRYRGTPPPGKKKAKNRLVHMLNGTAVATSRAIVALFENFQQADGTIAVPEVLRPWVGSDVLGPSRSSAGA